MEIPYFHLKFSGHVARNRKRIPIPPWLRRAKRRVVLRKHLPERGQWGDSIAHSVPAFPVVWRLIENPNDALRARVASSVNQKMRAVWG